jgi:hypothetical protein
MAMVPDLLRHRLSTKSRRRPICPKPAKPINGSLTVPGKRVFAMAQRC